jgi:N-acetylglucosaminyl-diphospho-decaprenol L-rhamnosyltransferase
MASKTDAIIVNWNGAAFLDRLLSQLETADLHQIIVVDNASSDGSAETAEKKSAIKTIRNPVNRGFGSAANQALQISTAPYALLLNVDIEITQEAIELMENYMESHPEAAIVAPQLLFADGKLQPSCRKFPTTSGLFLYLSYLDRIFPSSYRLKPEAHHQLMEVDQPMGAALLMRRSAINEIGFFDEQFFLYMEEVDLCDRIQRKGWKIVYIPDAKAIHFAGGSSNQDRRQAQKYFFESVIRYFRKRYDSSQLLLLRIALSAAMPFRAAILFARGRFSEAILCVQMMFRIFVLQ